METNQNTPFIFDYNKLVEGLKKEDTRNLKMMLNIQSMMWGIAGVYVFISALKFIMTTSWYDKLGGFLTLVAFVAFALLFRNYYKEYKSIDYGIPTIEMLKKAVNRYDLFQWRGFYILAPLILEGIGLNLMMFDDFTSLEPMSRILFFQMIYFIVIMIAFLVGYLIWKKRQKPLRDHALALLAEIEK